MADGSGADESWHIERGEILRRTEVHARYGGSSQSGIAPVRNSPDVLVFTGESGSKYGYNYDGWQSDGAFHYTGEGQYGEQKLTRGNKAIATPGRRLRLFRQVRKGHVQYLGEFRIDSGDSWYYADAPDAAGEMWKVIVFKLWPLDPSARPLVVEESADAAGAGVRGDASTPAIEADAGVAGSDEEGDDSGGPVATHRRWASDAPAKEDALHREGLARVLADRMDTFADDEPNSSFLLHIDGPWGSGKSTLLELLDKHLQERYLVVRFDAWKHAKVDPSWWALLVTLRQHVEKTRRRGLRWAFRLRDAVARARRGSKPYFAAALVGLLALVVLAAASWVTGRGIAGVLKGVNPLIGAASVFLLAVLGVTRFVWWDSAKGARRLEQVHTNPMQEVSQHFSWLLRRSPKRVVFFLDDLDRCGDQHVVEFLDAVQTLVRDAPHDGEKAAYFVVTAHGSWLRRAYETVHESFIGAVDEPGRGLGHLFLNKLFQLTVPMPTLGSEVKLDYLTGVLGVDTSSEVDAEEVNQARELIDTSASEADVLGNLQAVDPQVRQRVVGYAVDRLNEDDIAEKVTDHLLSRFSDLLDHNPRSMKRFVNTYGVFRDARTYEGVLVDSDVLAFWILLQIRWPVLTEYIEANLNTIEVDRDGQILLTELPDKFDSLLADPELNNVLEDDRVPRLTLDQVKACCGALSGRSPTSADSS